MRPGFEPLEGRRAVAQVVLNRMRHPAFPKSVCGVVYQGARAPVCQFSFVCDGSLYRRPALGAWKEAERIAAAALDGFVERSVGAATHYHADYVAPYWAPRLAKIVADRRAYLLSLAGRLGLDRRLHRPLHRRAGRSAVASPAASPGSADRRHAVPVEDPALAGPPIAARRKRCRRAARHVEGLDAEYPDAVGQRLGHQGDRRSADQGRRAARSRSTLAAR